MGSSHLFYFIAIWTLLENITTFTLHETSETTCTCMYIKKVEIRNISKLYMYMYTSFQELFSKQCILISDDIHMYTFSDLQNILLVWCKLVIFVSLLAVSTTTGLVWNPYNEHVVEIELFLCMLEKSAELCMFFLTLSPLDN